MCAHSHVYFILMFVFVILIMCVLQLERAYDQIILPLDNFRKEHIGGVKVFTNFNYLID